jgi:Tol biopolymer transport system component
MKRPGSIFLLIMLALGACSSPSPTPLPTATSAIIATPTAAPAIVLIDPTHPTRTPEPWPTSSSPTAFPTPHVHLIPEPGVIYFQLSQPETRNYVLIRVNSDGSGFETLLEADAFLVSAEARQIVYLSTGSPSNSMPDRILAANLDATDQRVIFEAPARHSIIWQNVAWSPDGRFIAVPTTIEDDVFPQRDTSIYVIPLDGGDPKLIYRAPEARDIEFLAWAPDSRAMVLIQSVLDPRADYYYSLSMELGVISRDAAPLKVLFASEEYLISSAVWSPDSRQLAYSIWLHDGTLETRASEGIYRTDVDGAEPTQVTSGWDTLGVWSTDGVYLYFRRGHETARSSIIRTRIDGTQQRPLTPPFRQSGLPRLSPSGEILFVPADNADRERLQPFEGIFTIRSIGEGLRQVIDSRVLGIVWSPSSRQIAYGSVTQWGRQGLCEEVLVVMNADGSGATPLTEEIACFSLLAWVK